jgi:uncharacterized protein with PQ loop repeat
MNPDVIGWASAAMLLATIVQQVYTQWKSGSTAGVSKWLFVGQTLASLGFTIYSAMTGNIVFVSVNAALLVSAIVGQLIYLRNRRRKARSEGEGRKANEGPSGPRSAQEA